MTATNSRLPREKKLDERIFGWFLFSRVYLYGRRRRIAYCHFCLVQFRIFFQHLLLRSCYIQQQDARNAVSGKIVATSVFASFPENSDFLPVRSHLFVITATGCPRFHIFSLSNLICGTRFWWRNNGALLLRCVSRAMVAPQAGSLLNWVEFNSE